MDKEKRLRVKELVQSIQSPFNADFKELCADIYHLEQSLKLAEEFENRYEFKAGTRVQMTTSLLDEKSRGTGWDYCSAHFLCTWNVGTVTDMSHIRDGVITVFVRWDFQPSRDGKVNDARIYPYSERKLKFATIDKPKVPKGFKCPDQDKEKKEKLVEKKRIKQKIIEKQKDLNKLEKELEKL